VKVEPEQENTPRRWRPRDESPGKAHGVEGARNTTNDKKQKWAKRWTVIRLYTVYLHITHNTYTTIGVTIQRRAWRSEVHVLLRPPMRYSKVDTIFSILHIILIYFNIQACKLTQIECCWRRCLRAFCRSSSASWTGVDNPWPICRRSIPSRKTPNETREPKIKYYYKWVSTAL